MTEIIQPLLPVRDLRKGGGVRKLADQVAMTRLMLVRLAGQPWRWSRQPHRKTARAKIVEDLVPA